MKTAGADLRDLRRVFGELPVARVGTVAQDGSPHVVPLWFVWLEDGVYLSIAGSSRTWSNVMGEPRISVVFDVGRTWGELAGVVLSGRAELLEASHPAVRGPMSAWHEKYRVLFPGPQFARFAERIPELGFLRLRPERAAPWDHARG
jgi:nitroimidazol reductase NimA-like FMN-containing flavoprotein (pyridoxamine 5'-phosphate oxidase superfamily)